jgi:quercetin dioxygenase-like cupin family protein
LISSKHVVKLVAGVKKNGLFSNLIRIAMNETNQQIAARLKGLREALNLTAQEVANDCHLEAQIYLEYEGGATEIPLGVLHTIAHTYDVELTALLTGEEPHMHSYSLTRKMQGEVVERSSEYKYHALAKGFINRQADPFVVTVEPKASGEVVFLNSHKGQEFNFILKGRLKFLLNGKEMILEEGDSIYFDCNLPHGMQALDNKECQFLAIII